MSKQWELSIYELIVLIVLIVLFFWCTAQKVYSGSQRLDCPRSDGYISMWRPCGGHCQKTHHLYVKTWQPNWMPTKISTPQLENSIYSDTESNRHCFQNKNNPTAAVPPSICIGTLCVGIRFALIRFQGTVSRQFSKRSPRFTNHRHHGNQSSRECPRKQLDFCEKIHCLNVFKKQFFLFRRGSPTWQPNWMVSTKLLATQVSTPQLENSIYTDAESYRHCLQNKKPNTTCSTLNLQRHLRFALIRSQGTLRCQDSSPNQAPVSRFTGITATNHVGNVHGNSWLFSFVRKGFMQKCSKNMFFSSKGPPPRDSQTGWFPRNFWPPKCQLRSWKIQFTLALNHTVVVFNSKNPSSSCSTFSLRRHSMCCNTFCTE